MPIEAKKVANKTQIKPFTTPVSIDHRAAFNSFENIHIYPLLCKLLEIKPSLESEGKLHVLESIVK